MPFQVRSEDSERSRRGWEASPAGLLPRRHLPCSVSRDAVPSSPAAGGLNQKEQEPLSQHFGLSGLRIELLRRFNAPAPRRITLQNEFFGRHGAVRVFWGLHSAGCGGRENLKIVPRIHTRGKPLENSHPAMAASLSLSPTPPPFPPPLSPPPLSPPSPLPPSPLLLIPLVR